MFTLMHHGQGGEGVFRNYWMAFYSFGKLLGVTCVEANSWQAATLGAAFMFAMPAVFDTIVELECMGRTGFDELRDRFMTRAEWFEAGVHLPLKLDVVEV
jgi:hypothetical protein